LYGLLLLLLNELSVDVPEHDVNGSDAGDDVRQQLSFNDERKRLQIYE
jgi:hypothetical protein